MGDRYLVNLFGGTIDLLSRLKDFDKRIDFRLEETLEMGEVLVGLPSETFRQPKRVIEDTEGSLDLTDQKNIILPEGLKVGGYLILRGLFWGNLIGITILLIQKYFGVITLDPETYYVNQVPIYLDLSYIVLLNIGTLLLCLLMLIVPSIVVSKISPAKSIKFE